jgi:hypothetical protein
MTRFDTVDTAHGKALVLALKTNVWKNDTPLTRATRMPTRLIAAPASPRVTSSHPYEYFPGLTGHQKSPEK